MEHLHADETTAGEIGELRALAGSLSARLGRLAARLDPMVLSHSGIAFGNLSPRGVLYPDRSPRAALVSPALEPGGDLVDAGTLLGHLHLLILGCPPPVRAELVEGVEAWLSGRLAACRDQWRSWLHVVLTVWAATVYNQVITELTLPAAALRLDQATADLPVPPLPAALSVLDALTRELRRRGAGAALNATLGALADSTASQHSTAARPRRSLTFHPFADRRSTSMAISLSRPPSGRSHPAHPAPPASAPASPPGQVVAVRDRSTDSLITLGRTTTTHPPERAFELLRGSAVRLLDRHVQRNGACEECGCAWPCRVVMLAENNLALVHDTAPAPPTAASAGRTAATPRAAASRIPSHPPAPPRRADENSPDPRRRENRITTAVATTPTTAPEPAVHLLLHRAWHYPTRPQSASAARHDVTAQLHRWNLGHVIDTITLLTSELVTNALAASLRGDDELTSQIAMRLTYSDNHVIVEVWDGGPGRPTRQTTDPDAEDGRGLHLVTALTPRTGYYQKKGKVVWAALPHNTPPTPSAHPDRPDQRPTTT